MVVDVSPCTVATSFGRVRRTARSTSAGSTTAPHGASTACTSAPHRPAISVSRCPNRPKTSTSTRSPGSSKETSAASIPARAVPSTSTVASLPVRNTCRYSDCVSPMYAVIAVSYCPTRVADMARRTRGSALMGPGPISSRGGGFTVCTG